MPDRRDVLKIGAALAAVSPFRLLAQPDEQLRRPIPSSGELLPVIGIGTNRYSRTDIELLRATLTSFANLGGGPIDTAPEYGNSEGVLGNLISELGIRDSVFAATKCDVRGARTSSQIDQSQAWMKTDVLDLVAVHSLTNWQDQLPVLREARADGRIRYCGVTVSRRSRHDALESILSSEELDFVQLNYSLADRVAAERLLPLAAERGVAVMVNVPFGRGRLFSAVDGRELPAWASEFDCHSWAQFFLKYIVSHPAVTCVIPGTTKEHHLVDNMGAGRGRQPDASMRERQEAFIDSL